MSDYPEPISVDDRMPNDNQEVMFYSFSWVVGTFNGSYWSNSADIYCSVTHWMPVPPDPEG